MLQADDGVPPPRPMLSKKNTAFPIAAEPMAEKHDGSSIGGRG